MSAFPQTTRKEYEMTTTATTTSREERADARKKAARRLLQDAEAEFDKGDMVRASENGWEAGAEAIIAAGILRGVECENYREMHFIACDLVDETGNMELYKLFIAIESLCVNTSQDWMPSQEVRECLDRVRKYVDALETIPAPEGEPKPRASRAALFIRDAKDWDEWKEANPI